MSEAFDSFWVEEAYAWKDDIMEITSRIVHETDEARLSNIADHFKVDLSEIREFIEMKRLTKRKPIIKADQIRSMTNEELAKWICDILDDDCLKEWVDWLQQETEEDK